MIHDVVPGNPGDPTRISKKDPKTRTFLDRLQDKMYGRHQDGVICVTCGATVPPESFRDDLSRKEFTISGMCQTCQDRVFGTDPYENILEEGF